MRLVLNSATVRTKSEGHLPRRVQHNDVGPLSPLRQHPGCLTRVPAEEFRVFNSVEPGVLPGVLHRLGDDLHPQQAPGMSMEGDQMVPAPQYRSNSSS